MKSAYIASRAIRWTPAAAVLAVVCIAGSALPTALALDPPERLVATVISISSGDTLLVAADGRRYRVQLEAAAAPADDDPAADEARRCLEDKLIGRKVRIEHLVEGPQRTLIGRVFLDDRSINKEMIDEGWARYGAEPGQFPVLEESEAAAREAKRGQWRVADPPTPDPAETAIEPDPMPAEASVEAEPGLLAGASDKQVLAPQFPNYVPRSEATTPAEEDFAWVIGELGRVQADLFTRARAIDDPAARSEILNSVDYAEQFSQPLLDVAAAHPTTETACWALLLVSQFEKGTTPASQQRLQQAIDSLLADHAQREEIGHLLLNLRGKSPDACDQSAVYRQLLEQAEHATVCGYACYLLAGLTSAGSNEEQAAEAVALWQRAATEFGDVKFGPQTLAEIAQAELTPDTTDETPSEEPAPPATDEEPNAKPAADEPAADTAPQ